MFCLQSALQVVDQHLQGDGLQLRTHSLAHGIQFVIQHIVDMPPDRAGGVRVLVEPEQRFLLLNSPEHIKHASFFPLHYLASFSLSSRW